MVRPDEFVHAIRAVVHAAMGSVALSLTPIDHELLNVQEEFIADIHPAEQFAHLSWSMFCLWSTIHKHYPDMPYVWLPSSGVLPDEQPEIGDDCFTLMDEKHRVRGGILLRLAQLEADWLDLPEPKLH